MTELSTILDTTLAADGALVDVAAVLDERGQIRPGAKALVNLLEAHGREWAYLTTGPVGGAAARLHIAHLPGDRIIAIPTQDTTEAVRATAHALGIDPRACAAITYGSALTDAAVDAGMIPLTLPQEMTGAAGAPKSTRHAVSGQMIDAMRIRALGATFTQEKSLSA